MKLSMEEVSYKFGENLREIRLEKNITQEEVAKKLKVGTSTNANWEQGRREPSLYYLILLAEFFEVDMNTLFDLL